MSLELTTGDKLEIHELVARYNRAVDGGDAESWAETFTEDGEFQSLLVGTYAGRESLLAFAQGFDTDSRTTTWTGGQHWIGNIIIEGDHDRAEVFSYHLMFVPAAQMVPAVLMAAHEDVCVRTADGWRFAVRKLIPWPPGSDPSRWSSEGAE